MSREAIALSRHQIARLSLKTLTARLAPLAPSVVAFGPQYPRRGITLNASGGAPLARHNHINLPTAAMGADQPLAPIRQGRCRLLMRTPAC